MYAKPALEKLGSFRDLTQFGWGGPNDPLAFLGIGSYGGGYGGASTS